MTIKHVVSSNDLGEITRKFHKIVDGIFKGSIETERALFFLELATSGIPKVQEKEWADGTYALQCEWTGGKHHYELATISFEEEYISPEQVLNPEASEQKKEKLIEILREIFEAQVSFEDSYKMLRVYRVLSIRYFGFDPHHGVDGILERLDTVDVHLILKPLFDFNEEGKPIPCVTE